MKISQAPKLLAGDLTGQEIIRMTDSAGDDAGMILTELVLSMADGADLRSSLNDTTIGAATFSGLSGATVPDYQGIIHDTKADEARFRGARRVERIDINDDLTTWDTVSFDPPAFIDDPEGGNTAIRLTVAADPSGVASITLTDGIPSEYDGKYIVASMWIRQKANISSNPALNRTYLYVGSGETKHWAARPLLPLPLGGGNAPYDDVWQRVHTLPFLKEAGPATIGVIGEAWSVGDPFDFWHPQYEVVDLLQDNIGISEPMLYEDMGANVSGVRYSVNVSTWRSSIIENNSDGLPTTDRTAVSEERQPVKKIQDYEEGITKTLFVGDSNFDNLNNGRYFSGEVLYLESWASGGLVTSEIKQQYLTRRYNRNFSHIVASFGSNDISGMNGGAGLPDEGTGGYNTLRDDLIAELNDLVATILADGWPELFWMQIVAMAGPEASPLLDDSYRPMQADIQNWAIQKAIDEPRFKLIDTHFFAEDHDDYYTKAEYVAEDLFHYTQQAVDAFVEQIEPLVTRTPRPYVDMGLMFEDTESLSYPATSYEAVATVKVEFTVDADPVAKANVFNYSSATDSVQVYLESGSLHFEITVGTQQSLISQSLSAGKHIVIVYWEAGNCALYLDGALINTDTPASVPAAVDGLTVGGVDTGLAALGGHVTEFRRWPYLLTDAVAGLLSTLPTITPTDNPWGTELGNNWRREDGSLWLMEE